MTNGYELLDSGNFQKLERFGEVVLSRPCAQAVWRQTLPPNTWQKATASFFRDGGNQWRGRDRLPSTWDIGVDGTRFQLSSTDFGHLGIFPEQRDQWKRIREACGDYQKKHNRAARVLNLFAYSGGSTLAAAHGGAEVCHVDASKGMVDWARKNATLNGLDEKPIRWIVDDVTKFLEREYRRERTYDLIILDPPSYGRGAKGEIFKIENDLPPLLSLIGKLIVHGRTRRECIMRLRRALAEMVVGGVFTTLDLHRRLVDNEDVLAGNYNIHWLEKFLDENKITAE